MMVIDECDACVVGEERRNNINMNPWNLMHSG
jgi:hypothetical protein